LKRISLSDIGFSTLYLPAYLTKKHHTMRKNILKFSFFLSFFTGIILCSFQSFSQENYKGKPFNGIVQKIPGKIQCELYDIGGEGIAYHDNDSVNNGSGKLNPADGTYLNEFRMKEGVDISYTKIGGTDDNDYNFVKPEMGQLYVGWTMPGEWINYSVEVTKSGKYDISMMYTSNQGGSISLSIDGKDITGPLKITTTYQEKDTVAWRQWHHWNLAQNLATVNLKKGKHILTLHTVDKGQMNYDWIEFKLKNK
jgi:hypothetical protein